MITRQTNFDSSSEPTLSGSRAGADMGSEPSSTLPGRDIAPRGPVTKNGTNARYGTNGPRDEDFHEAQALGQVCERFLQLTDANGEGGGHSLRTAASMLGKSVSFFSGKESMFGRWQRGGVEGLLKVRGVGTKPGDLTAQIEALGWFIPAANLFWLICNRTWNSGSMPEAVRRVISLPHLPVGWKESDKRKLLRKLQLDEVPSCPPELRAALIARERAGQPLVPNRIAKQIRLNPATVRQYRNPREASLDFLNSPGGMRLFSLPDGTRRLARAGEIIEADDGTVNFPVCVPWERDGSGDPCVEKYGVKLSRFQWLLSVCAGTSYIPGFSYTARPRSSYRAEDIVSLMRTVTQQHGIPRTWRFERGAWESKLVKSAISGMGSRLDTVYSPHQKPFIEGLFNTLWTKLSVHFPGGHVGRSQGEEREANLLLAACKAGHKDPRRYFPMLSTAIAAFQEVIREKNSTPVNSAHHGRWIPEERWERELALPRLDAAGDWMFAPFAREWKIQGMLAGGRVPMFEGMRGIPFDFSASWMPSYHGAKVRCHFDPADARCSAMVVLAEKFRDEPAGKILGPAALVNDTAGYVRMVMGWGEDPAMAGAKARQQAAAALRREVRAVLPRGERGAEASEERDGLGKVTKITNGEFQVANAEKAAEVPTPVEDAARKVELETRERANEEFFEKNVLDFL